MYVYPTTDVEEAAKRLGVNERLSSLLDRLQQGDPKLLEQMFDIRFPYWKRNLGNNTRLLGEWRWLDGVPILILFALWGRGSREYRDFLDQRTAPSYQDSVRAKVKDEVLRNWLKEQRQRQELSGAPPELPAELRGWTQFLHRHDYRERLVLESAVWVRQMQKLTPAQHKQVYEAVVKLVDKPSRYQDLPDLQPGAAVKCWTEETVHLAVSLVNVEGYREPFPFLIGVYNREPVRDELFALGKETDLFGSGARNPRILEECKPLEVWKRHARRAYPDYMVVDEEIWLEMQAESEGNLALSMEEEAILQEESMPLLINGRAGSGKSLMLYYRFADYCSYYLKHGRYESPEYTPLFLTYSPSLVQQARDKVSKILRVSHFHRQQQEFSSEEINRCRDFFSTFQEYLLNCLPPERQERYQPERYINFYQFRCRYSYFRDVELAWHTIRTLIKGYDVSNYLDPEGYQELPPVDRSVEDSFFDDIYKKIWPGYLELTTPGHGDWWDDQDLVRDVLENGTLKPVHPVIFCDEIQDFTRIELSVILCLSPWGNFKLDLAIQHLPYAFAGDPLQTINPTGFRWSVLKQYLFEHIKSYLLPNHRFQVDDPKELRNNYRCSPHITRFSNVVNLWRRILSYEREEKVSPQYPWWPHEERIAVQRFIIGKNLTRQELQRMLSASTGTVCILPCAVGEELDYARRDPHLQTIFARDLEQGQKPIMLQTVTAVKGMEFKKIILYKFGEHYCGEFHHKLTTYAERKEISLKLRYFLNQLYVGITRPIEALAIVDTQEAQQQFWDPALPVGFWLEWLPEAEQQQWQRDHTLRNSPVDSGNIKIWIDKNLEDVEYLVLEFLKRGVEEANPDALATALGYARQLGRQEWVKECKAWIAKLERHYLQAGEQFLQLSASALPKKNLKREAWECFWKGKAWSALQQHHQIFEGIPDIHDYSPLVDLMVLLKETTAKPSATKLFRQVVRVRDWLSTGISPKRWDPTWKSGVEEFLKQLERVVNSLESFCPRSEERSQFLQETCVALTDALTVLDRQPEFASQRLKILGNSYFYQGEFEKAITVWEQGKATEHSLYYKAKIQVEPLPPKLVWLSKDRQDQEVLQQWQKAGYSLEGGWREYRNVIITSLERLKQWTLLLRVLIQCRNWKQLWQTVQAHPQSWRRGHDYELVATVARDLDTDWRIFEGNDLRHFLRQVLASLAAEYAWLSVQQILELGLAYERLGFFRDALDFYNRFTELQDTEEVRSRERSQIRQRWLKTCQSYINDLQNQGRPTDILETQLQQKQERWEESIPKAELELPDRHIWSYPLVENPSPVQQWLLEQDGSIQHFRTEIQRSLEQLNDRQLQQVYSTIQHLQRSS